MVLYVLIGMAIGLLLGLVIHKVTNWSETFGTIETNLENGQTLFRFVYERDPKNMINCTHVIFKTRPNKELHSLKDLGDVDSQK